MEDKIRKYINLAFPFILILVFVFITLKSAVFSGRMGWEDEAHFWTMVKNCSIGEIFSLMKVEGHMLLWYLVVMPFAKIGLPYPYPMQVLNWIFCFGAILLIWKKSPFHPLVKMGITLSPVFLQLYGVHARCYSIGIFFLFFACALYKERLQKPYLYFTMLALAANTSLQGLIGASALGIPFLYELFKDCYDNKKSYKQPIIISCITLLIGLLLASSFIKVAVPDYETYQKGIIAAMNYLGTFVGINPVFGDKLLLAKIVGLRLMVFVLTFIFAVKYRAFFVYFFTFSLSAMFFLNIYRPRVWHLAFFFIYFLISYWIFLEEKPDIKLKNALLLISYVFFACLLTIEIKPPFVVDVFTQFVEQNKEIMQKGKIFSGIVPITLSVTLPRINEYGIYIYDLKGRNLSKYEGLKTYFDGKAKESMGTDVYEHLSNDKPNYILAQYDINEVEHFAGVNNKLIQKTEIDGRNLYLFEILKKEDNKDNKK